MTRDTEKCPLFVSTGVRIKLVIFREIYELFVGTNETVPVIVNNYSSSPVRPKAERAINSETMRAKGIIVLVKSNWLVKNFETKQL